MQNQRRDIIQKKYILQKKTIEYYNDIWSQSIKLNIVKISGIIQQSFLHMANITTHDTFKSNAPSPAASPGSPQLPPPRS